LKFRTVLVCGLLAAGALAGCNRQAEKDLAEIRAKQDEILAKLSAIQDAQQKQVQARQGPPPEDYNKVYPIPIADSPVRGDADGPVTIVEFSDFQCPFCARAAPVIEDVLKKYPKGVRFVYKQFPLPMHPMARPAAQASLAAQE
jgi:protein-disulfide isomerase